jgi:HSP20 family molecular chaperone IbpA
MTYTNWNILSTAGSFRRNLEQLFNEVFSPSGRDFNQLALFGWKPVADLFHGRDETLGGWRYRNDLDLKGSPASMNDAQEELLIEERSDSLLIQLKLTEIRKESLYLELSGEILILRGERIAAARPQAETADFRRTRRFQRLILLPGKTRPTDVTARFIGNSIQIRISRER